MVTGNAAMTFDTTSFKAWASRCERCEGTERTREEQAREWKRAAHQQRGLQLPRGEYHHRREQ